MSEMMLDLQLRMEWVHSYWSTKAECQVSLILEQVLDTV
jgi:hypothetical protein